MFAGLIVFLLIGFPVAFSLSALGLFFGLIAIEVGYFGLAVPAGAARPGLRHHVERPAAGHPVLHLHGGDAGKIGPGRGSAGRASGQLFGRIPGGLAYAVIFVGAILGAITGTVAASVIAMGMISLPIMLKYGYDMKIGTGVIAASGTITQVIPPSLVLIVLADPAGRVGGRHVSGRHRAVDHAGARCSRCFILLRLDLPRRIKVPALPPEARTLRGGALAVQGRLGHGARRWR